MEDGAAPLNVFRTMFGDEARQCMDLLPSPRPFGFLYFTSRQSFGFQLQVGFRVDVSGVN
jgi:hypothetical protein